MTRPHQFFVQNTLVAAAQEFKDDNAGRLFSGLGTSQTAARRELGELLLAVLMQERDPKFREYLAGDPEATTTAPAKSDPVPDNTRPEYKRPNGSLYYARKWDDYWDVELLKEAREVGQFPLLQGPPGTGKTAMAEAAFGDELVTIVITGETTVSELVGSFIPDGKGGYVWVDGPLLVAVREGRPILLDEILLGDPKVLSVLYPLMDGRGFLDVTENPKIGVVSAKEGFFIIGTGNPGVPGAKMSRALSSRFPLQVEVVTDWDLALSLGVDSRVVTFCQSLAARASGSQPSISWAPQMREMLTFNRQEELWGLRFAIRNLLRLCPEQDLDDVRTQARNVWPSIEMKPARIGSLS